jgi:hypothetical protein
VVTVFEDTLSKNFILSTVDQGGFDLGEITIGGYLNQLSPVVQVETQDLDFCNSHDIVAAFSYGSAETPL